MQGTITYNELGIVILFLVLLGIGSYVIIVLKNFNRLVKNANRVFDDNREDLCRIIPNLAAVSDILLSVSRQVAKEVDEVRTAVKTITSNTTDTVVKFNETADRIGTYAVLVGELARVAADLLGGAKKSSGPF